MGSSPGVASERREDGGSVRLRTDIRRLRTTTITQSGGRDSAADRNSCRVKQPV